ncbi:MAG: carboxymuconolactone decarboxylase family protein [Sphingomicrobium sp.]
MSDTALSRIPRDQLDPQWQGAWDMLNGLTGEPTFIEAMASAPELLNFAMVEFYQKIFFGGRVEQKYKQLVRLRLSLAHGCRSCNLQNRVGAREAGYDDVQIASIEGDRTGFTDAERAVLDFADEMILTNPGGRLDEALHRRLRAHFNDAQICELGVVAGFIGGMAKMAFVLDLVEKEPSCPFAPAAAAAAA